MRIQKRNNPYTPLRFSEVGLSAQYLADIIETRLKDLTNILLKYESHEVVQDEVARTLDLLKHLKENKKYQFGFIMNPPLMREIFLTARANETMPRKSTYFYPKVYSGIVINKMDK